ncbi:hypothetical protein LDENG_00132650 [Lucifuga dentata]|nr:hypothetical protein LDENG_00132650 [Lucifuga dentata]
MAHFYLQNLLFLFLLIIPESSEETVSAAQEEDATLPCFKSTMMAPESCYRVKWTKLPTDPSNQPKVIFASPQSAKFQNAEGVKWGADGNGQMSLSLKRLNKSDEGPYRCEIFQGWDCKVNKTIYLKVKDCKTLQAVKAAPGTIVNLHCPVDVISEYQQQNVSWAMLKGGFENPIFLNSKKIEINGTSLVIYHVNFSDSGWFRCKYLLDQTHCCFDLKLQTQVDAHVAITVPAIATETVQARATSVIIWETKIEGSSGAFIALVSSAIIGFVVITSLIIGLVIYCRCNTKRLGQHTQRNPDFMQPNDTGYEDVELPVSEEHRDLHVNSLYEHFQDEGLCTFQR